MNKYKDYFRRLNHNLDKFNKQYLMGNLKNVSRFSFLFIVSSISLIILNSIQMSCPVCGGISLDSENNSMNIKAIQVEAELLDYKSTYPGCGYHYSYCIYDVEIIILNESSNSLSTPILIHGSLPQEAVKVHPTWSEKNAKLINVEMKGGEEKRIQEIVQLWVVGLDVGKDVISQVDFSIITDPRRIKSNCPVCDGTEKIAFHQWLMEIIE